MMKIYEKVWSSATGNPLTCTNATDNWFELPMPHEMLIYRVAVGCEGSSPPAFSITLYSHDVQAVNDAQQRAAFKIIPTTSSSSGIASVTGTYPYARPVTVRPPTIWLNVTGTGLSGKKLSVSIAGRVGGSQ